MEIEINELVARVAKLEQRNTKLERQSSWMKRFGAFAIVAVTSGVVLMGQAPNGTIEAKRFVIKDDAGNTRAFMDAAQGHGRIWLYDEDSKVRTFIGGGKLSPGLQVNNAAGSTRIKMVDEANGAYIAAYDGTGKEIFHKP